MRVTRPNLRHFSRFQQGYADPVQSLLAEGQLVGRDLPLTTVRAGVTRSVFDPTVDIAANTADISSQYEVMVRNGATNKVPGDCTLWDDVPTGGGTVALSTDEMDFNQPVLGDRIYVRYISIPVTSGEKYSMTVEVTENTMSGTVWVIREITDANTLAISTGQTGTFTLTWTASATGTTQIFLGPGAIGASQTGTMKYRNVRMVESGVQHPGFEIGSAAGATYGTDKVSCTPTWGSEGTIFQVVTPYGYSGTNNPADPDARFLETGNTFAVLRPGDTRVTGSGFSPGITTGGSVVDGSVMVHSLDWNGAVIGVRWSDTYSRTTEVETEIPSGDLLIGIDASGNRSFHGTLITLIFNRVLSDAEYNTLRAYYTSLLANRVPY